jgi:hypothetical protein
VCSLPWPGGWRISIFCVRCRGKEATVPARHRATPVWTEREKGCWRVTKRYGITYAAIVGGASLCSEYSAGCWARPWGEDQGFRPHLEENSPETAAVNKQPASNLVPIIVLHNPVITSNHLNRGIPIRWRWACHDPVSLLPSQWPFIQIVLPTTKARENYGIQTLAHSGTPPLVTD